MWLPLNFWLDLLRLGCLNATSEAPQRLGRHLLSRESISGGTGRPGLLEGPTIARPMVAAIPFPHGKITNPAPHPLACASPAVHEARTKAKPGFSEGAVLPGGLMVWDFPPTSVGSGPELRSKHIICCSPAPSASAASHACQDDGSGWESSWDSADAAFTPSLPASPSWGQHSAPTEGAEDTDPLLIKQQD